MEYFHSIRDFTKKTVVFLPLLFLLVLTNIFIDPANLFSRDYEKKAAEILLKGLNIANISNCDQRMLQKCYIENLKEKKNIAVLGSSRILQIGQELFSGMNLSLFNNGIPGASLEDNMAIFEMYLENGKEPNVILLELSPWLLNKNSNQTRWKSISDYYTKYIKRVKTPGDDREDIYLKNKWALFCHESEKNLQIFSLSYFQRSIKYLFQMIRSKKSRGTYYATKAFELDVDVKLYDGSVNYNTEHRLIDADEVRQETRRSLARKKMYSLDRFYELDSSLKQQFEMFVVDLLRRNIKVRFILVPYHQDIYHFLSNDPDYKIILEEEEYFRGIAAKHNLPVIGSYNPDICGFVETDFYDSIHVKREAIGELIKNEFLLNY